MKEVTTMYANDVSRWTAEALTALQEVTSILLRKLDVDILTRVIKNLLYARQNLSLPFSTVLIAAYRCILLEKRPLSA